MAQTDDAPDFLAFLRSVEGGRFAEDASDALRDLVTAMRRQVANAGGKPKGALTLKLSLKLDGGLFEVDGGISVAQPKPVRERTILYAGADGALTPNNPKQLTMDLPSAPAPLAPALEPPPLRKIA